MKYRKVYKSIGEFEYDKSKGNLYEGFVIGLGYAYILSKRTLQKRKVYGEPESYYYATIRIQEIEITEETVKMSFPPIQKDNPAPASSADVRTVLFALAHPIVALDVGEYKRGSVNISSNAVRFATRENILQNGEKGKNEDGNGTQVNAFRHTLWQSYITNKHGLEMATQIGNVHEENPNANLSRRFKTLKETDQTVDLLNNTIGRSMGNTSRMGMRDMAIKVLEVFYQDGLYTAKKNEDGTWYIDRTKITKKQYEALLNVYKSLNDYGRYQEEQDKIDKEAKEKLESQQITWGTMK